MSFSIRLAIILVAIGVAGPIFAAENDWQCVGEALGKSGQEILGGVYRVGLPRTDLHVKLDGRPGLALGSWVAFEKMSGTDAMVMGGLVLTQDEIGPVIKKLEDGGVEIIALHNHLLRDEPFTLYMHALGHGDRVTLAATLHEALALSKTPLGGAAASGSSLPAPAAFAISATIDALMLESKIPLGDVPLIAATAVIGLISFSLLNPSWVMVRQGGPK